jgi:hypothetical protein
VKNLCQALAGQVKSAGEEVEQLSRRVGELQELLTVRDGKKKRKFVFFSCRIGTKINPALESQKLKDCVFREYGDAVLFEHIPQPQTKHFSEELERIGNQEVSLHFSGHGDARSGGLCWHGDAGRKTKQMQIRGKELASLIQLHCAVEKIDCFFLNACCTLSAGLELHKIGVRVVVCWQTSVPDSTARKFATRFYYLSFRAPGQHAKAFAMVCNEMSGVLSEARPCLLQASYGQEQSGVKMWWDGRRLRLQCGTPPPVSPPVTLEAAGAVMAVLRPHLGVPVEEEDEWKTEEELTDDEDAEAIE